MLGPTVTASTPHALGLIAHTRDASPDVGQLHISNGRFVSSVTVYRFETVTDG